MTDPRSLVPVVQDVRDGAVKQFHDHVQKFVSEWLTQERLRVEMEILQALALMELADTPSLYIHIDDVPTKPWLRVHDNQVTLYPIESVACRWPKVAPLTPEEQTAFVDRMYGAMSRPLTNPEVARRNGWRDLPTWFVDSSRFTADSANEMTRRLHGHDD